MNERCEVVWALLVNQCAGTAVGRFRRACVHEHVKDGWMCQEHVDLVEYGLCATCHELPVELSHECPITIEPVQVTA